MNQMMDGGGTMMWGIGYWGLLVTALAVLGIGALVKYFFFDAKK